MANSWINRTPSGLPLCSTCNKELGFCPHSPTLREGARVGDKEREGAANSAPTGSGEAVSDTGAVPFALRINEAGQSHESASPEERPKHGTKRRPPAALQGKGKRRSVLVQSKGAPALSAPDEKDGVRVRRNPPRSTRTREEERKARPKKRATLVSSDDGGGGSGATNEADVDEKTRLLRFPGFEANGTGQQCISCYEVAPIMVNFACEGRREKEAEKARAAAERRHRSSHESTVAGAEAVNTAAAGRLGMDVPHVMCVDCFCVDVESRVSERMLVTSRDFDGYTVGCPMGCADSFIDPSCFEEVMGAEFMVKYRRFAAIHLASHLRVVWCPGCHCGVVPSAAAAAAAGARRSSVNPMPDLQQEQMAAARSGVSGLWDLWGGGRGAARSGAERQEEEEEGGGGAAARPRASFCIGCPGCQASLCMLCRELHAPGISCADAAAGAAVAGEKNGEEGGSCGGGDGGEGSGAARRASTGSQKDEEELDDSPTKRCPGCHVPIFKDGGCNHMKCSRCHFEFCWLHLTEWVEGGECQRGHWSSNPALNRAYNAQRMARQRQRCTIS
ncbi:unnamed protein product [Ectocarpus sp. 12 AP-2014]